MAMPVKSSKASKSVKAKSQAMDDDDDQMDDDELDDHGRHGGRRIEPGDS